MVSEETMMTALELMWTKSEVGNSRHGLRSHLDVQIEIDHTGLHAIEYVGAWDDRTILELFLYNDILAGFRQLIGQNRGLRDEEHIDYILKLLVKQSADKYAKDALIRGFLTALIVAFAIILPVLITGKALGKAGLLPIGLGVCVGIIGWWLIHKRWRKKKSFWDNCNTWGVEGTIASLEKLEEYLKKKAGYQNKRFF